MAELYKEYLAHVPEQWQQYTTPAGVPPAKGGKPSFAHCLPKGPAATAAFRRELEREEAASIANTAARRRGPLGERWIKEMEVAVAEDRQKEETQRRAKRLDEVLMKKHEAFLRRKEREMMPPTVDGAPMPARFHALADRHPSAVRKYQAMLSAGSAVALQEARNKVHAVLDAQEAATDERAHAHHDEIVRKGTKAVEHRKKEVHEQFTAHERKLDAAQQRCERLQREKERRQQVATEAAEKKRLESEARLRDVAEQRDSEARRRDREAVRKREAMAAAAEQRRRDFEARMAKQQQVAQDRRAITEAMRHQRKRASQERGDGGNYERAMHARETARDAQRAEGIANQERREERAERIAAERAQAHKELLQSHSQRRERVEKKQAQQWQTRGPSIERELERAHEPRRLFRPVQRRTPTYLLDTNGGSGADPLDLQSPTKSRDGAAASTGGGRSPSPRRPGDRFSPPPASVVDPEYWSGDEASLTRQRVEHARRNLAAQQRAEELRRQQQRSVQHDRDASVAAGQSSEHKRTRAKLALVDRRRQEVLVVAAEREEERQRRVDEAAEARAAKAAEQLEALEKERKAAAKAASAAKASRTAACLDEVNVVRHETLMKSLDEKQKRRAAFEQARDAERQQAAAEEARRKHEHDALMAERTRAAEAERQRRADEARRRHDEAVGRAAAARDAHLHAKQRELAQQDSQRRQRVRETSEQREADHARFAHELNENERRRDEKIAEERAERERLLRKHARQHDAQIETAQERNAALQHERCEKTQKKLEHVAQRASTSLAERIDAVKHVQQDARAHARTPAPETPAVLLSHRRRRPYSDFS